MNYNFRKAHPAELAQIWEIIQQAIARRKKDGSRQWQDGYPNEDIIKQDIEKGFGYVLTGEGDEIIGYAAILFNDEPAYEKLKGTWLTNGDFAAVHRIAIPDRHTGKGLAKQILHFSELLAMKNNVFSVKT